MEYLVQVETLFIVGFLTWRVDTIQQLSVGDEEFGPVRCAAGSQGLTSGGEDDTLIRSRLQEYCETTKLYLQHDLSLAQLSQAVGVDRADLSRYFARQGFTYNAYINRLRIDHFALLYREAVARQRPVTAQQLAFQCGFSSYSTFGVAFKQFMGQTATSGQTLCDGTGGRGVLGRVEISCRFVWMFARSFVSLQRNFILNTYLSWQDQLRKHQSSMVRTHDASRHG